MHARKILATYARYNYQYVKTFNTLEEVIGFVRKHPECHIRLYRYLGTVHDDVELLTLATTLRDVFAEEVGMNKKRRKDEYNKEHNLQGDYQIRRTIDCSTPSNII